MIIRSYTTLCATLAFRIAQKKWPCSERPGDLGGKGMPANPEMRWSPKTCQKTRIGALAVWEVAPSCWHRTRGIRRNSGTKKLAISMQCSEVTEAASLPVMIFKRVRINDGNFSDSTPGSHFFAVQWSLVWFSRVFEGPKATVLKVHHPTEMKMSFITH